MTDPLVVGFLAGAGATVLGALGGLLVQRLRRPPREWRVRVFDKTQPLYSRALAAAQVASSIAPQNAFKKEGGYQTHAYRPDGTWGSTDIPLSVRYIAESPPGAAFEDFLRAEEVAKLEAEMLAAETQRGKNA